ncbi:pea pathogenicity protein, partial [Hyaloscypha bicolor E]
SIYIQAVNLRVWKPGRDLVVNEIIIRFEGRLKEITTVSNKPIPTGYKVWGVAQKGFLLV